MIMQAATCYDNFDRETKYRRVQSRVFAWVSQRLSTCSTRHRVNAAWRKWRTVAASEISPKALQRRNTLVVTITQSLRLQFLGLAWRRWRLAAAWVHDRQVGNFFKQRSRQGAITIIRSVVHALRNRRLVDSWSSWRLHTVQMTHNHLLTVQQSDEKNTLFGRVLRRLRTRWMREAWQTWTRMCTAVAYQDRWDDLARRARVYAVATLERGRVSLNRELLQRSWSTWRQRTLAALATELREVSRQ